MKYTKNLGLIIGVVVIVIIALLVGGREGRFGALVFQAFEPQEAETLKIGALLCQTGSCAEWGENSLDGVMLAVEEINASGGVLGKQIEVVAQDSDESNPVNTVTGYRNLVSQGIEYIVGPTWTAGGNALYPVASQDDVIVTSPSLGVAAFNESGENMFNLWPHDVLATEALAHFTSARGYKRAAVFGSKETWYKEQSDAFVKAFEADGGEIVHLEEVPTTIHDVKTIASKILASNPDVVMYTHFDAQGIMAKELKLRGYTGAQVSILMDDTRVQQASGAFTNAHFVQYDAASGAFQDAYKAKYAKVPGIAADTAYDVVYLYKQAIEEAGTTDVVEVTRVLNSYKTFNGASGSLTFDDEGGVTKPAVFWKVLADGSFERVGTE